MKLRQLFENIYEEQNVSDVAIIFGRFNPPHQGHKAAWETASNFPEWFVGTNESTVGPKDPLPFKVKLAAMEAIWPDVKGHLVAEQSWWTFATMIYKKFGTVTLHVVTDANDAKVFVKGLQDQNGKEGPHGYYRFKDIVWEEAARISSATDLRAAVANNDKQAFEQAAGVPADTPIAGHPFFDVVKHFLSPYLQADADKKAAKAERDRLKAEKAAKKQPQPQEIEASEEFGVGRITAQNTTADVNASTPGKNLRAFRLAEEIARMEQELQEATQTKISKRQQQSTRGVNTFGDGERVNGDYTMYRLSMAAASTDGKLTPNMDAKSWIGKTKAAFPYTQEEQDILKKAYKAVGASHKDLNGGDMNSKELDTTNRVSPIAKRKRNKYGV
jgi:hypothetical protein